MPSRVTALLVLVACSACAARTPSFETIERPPEHPNATEPTPPAPPTLYLPPPEAARASLVRRLFLALAIGDQKELEALLRPGARIGRKNQNLSEANPAALAELLALFRSPEAPSSTPGARPESLPFAQSQLLDLVEGKTFAQSEFSVSVEGSPPVRGTWRITVEHEPELRIIRVVLPPEP